VVVVQHATAAAHPGRADARRLCRARARPAARPRRRPTRMRAAGRRRQQQTGGRGTHAPAQQLTGGGGWGRAPRPGPGSAGAQTPCGACCAWPGPAPCRPCVRAPQAACSAGGAAAPAGGRVGSACGRHSGRSESCRRRSRTHTPALLHARFHTGWGVWGCVCVWGGGGCCCSAPRHDATTLTCRTTAALPTWCGCPALMRMPRLSRDCRSCRTRSCRAHEATAAAAWCAVRRVAGRVVAAARRRAAEPHAPLHARAHARSRRTHARAPHREARSANELGHLGLVCCHRGGCRAGGAEVRWQLCVPRSSSPLLAAAAALAACVWPWAVAWQPGAGLQHCRSIAQRWRMARAPAAHGGAGEACGGVGAGCCRQRRPRGQGTLHSTRHTTAGGPASKETTGRRREPAGVCAGAASEAGAAVSQHHHHHRATSHSPRA
jgi:hypothetical protein